MSVIRNLIIALQAQTNQFEQGMERSKKEIQSLAKEAKRGGDAIADLEKRLINAATNAAKGYFSFQVLKSGITALVEEGERSQNLTRAFTAIAGSAAGARRELVFITETANRLGVSNVGLANSYKGLTAASRGTTLEGARTREIFDAVSKAGRVLGLSSDEVNGSLLAIQQMMSKGRVASEELRGQLGERLPGAFQIASRAMGVSTAELGKMLKDGEVISEEFLPKFAKQLMKELGQGTLNATNTASQGWARMGNAIREIVSGPGKDLSNWLGDVLTRMADIINKGQKTAATIREIGEAQAKWRLSLPGMEGVGENDKRRARLVEIETKILATEKELADLRSRGDTGARADAEVRRLQNIISQQKESRDLLLENIRLQQKQTSTQRVNRESDLEDPAIMEDLNEQRDLANKRKESLAKAIDDVVKAGVDAEQKALAIGNTQAEALEARFKAIKKELDDLVRAYPELMKKTGGSFISKAPPELAGKIRSAAEMQRLDPALFDALIWQESRYNPRAVSPAGAMGLGQLMPGTAKDLGVTDPFNIEQNLAGSAKYLRQQLNTFKDTQLALAAYNAGPGRVQAAGNRIPNIRETQDYVKSVTERAAASQTGGAIPESEAVKRFQDLAAANNELGRAIKERKDIEKETLDIDKAVQQADERRMETFGKLAESLEDETKVLSESAEAKIRDKLATLDAESATRLHIESLIDQKRAYANARDTIEAFAARQKVLAEEQEEEIKRRNELVKEAYLLRREMAQQESDDAKKFAEETSRRQEELGALTIGTTRDFISALREGGDALDAFAQRFADMLLRMAMEKSGFEAKLGEWLGQGMGLISKSFGGGGLTLDALGGDVAAGGIDMSAFLTAGRAEGGSVQAHMPYLVGEKGPEVFVPGNNGSVVPNNKIGGSLTVNMVINTPDAGSFQRSRAEIQRNMVNAMVAAQRSA